MQSSSIAGMQHVQKELARYNVTDLRELPVHIRRQVRREKQRIDLANVFGAGHNKDKDGNPVEQGVGSAFNMTRQSVDAYVAAQTKMREKPEEGYDANLARMKAQLAECEKRRRVEEAAKEAAEQEEYELQKREMAGLLGDDDE